MCEVSALIMNLRAKLIDTIHFLCTQPGSFIAKHSLIIYCNGLSTNETELPIRYRHLATVEEHELKI